MRQRCGWWVTVGTALGICLGLAGPLAGGERVARWEEGSGLSEPKVIEKAPPGYPEEARKERVEGVVILEATITAQGSIWRYRVRRGSGHRQYECQQRSK